MPAPRSWASRTAREARVFGSEASTADTTERLERENEGYFRSLDVDIRDGDAVAGVFKEAGSELALVIHTAAQPSHDWAASDPHTDFTVNAWAR
jgi:CDP-paratose 2-epimerase